MGINLKSTAGFTTGVLIADTYQAPNGSNDSISSGFTKIGGLPVAAALELQSTEGALLLPRMTTAERDAMQTAGVSAISPGMVIYNIDTDDFNFRKASSWTAGEGNVNNNGGSTDNAVARFDGNTGSFIQNSVVLISDTGVMTGVTQLNLWRLPVADATIPGQFLSSNAAGTPGVLSWATGVMSNTTLLTATAVKGLSTPVTLIAAPGSGKMILPLSVSVTYNFVTTQFGVTTGKNLDFVLGTNQMLTAIAATGLLDQTASTVSTSTAASLAGIVKTGFDNVPLQIKNSGADFATGDGTVDVTVMYTIVSL